jgi:3',5'-cyclic AMP phosphodiesterase CpdA
MKLVVTADLHYNHPKSRPLAEDLIAQINREGGDVLLLAGDTAITDADHLERCLSLFEWKGPRLFTPGNHELWTRAGDSYRIYHHDLPTRLAAVGWHYLDHAPYVTNDFAIVGSVGWYDYSFAQPSLGIPARFYAHKLSPGAAEYLGTHPQLFERTDDISPLARETVARWNDGKFVHLGRSDEAFLAELLATLGAQLDALAHVPRVIAATHHLPFRELLPPPHSAQWDFAKAYLGSQQLGDLLLRVPNVTHVFCGHSHRPAEAQVGHIRAVDIGAGYRWKTYPTLDL